VGFAAHHQSGHWRAPPSGRGSQLPLRASPHLRDAMTTLLRVETVVRVVEGDVRFNLASDARTFDCKFIEPGLISYRDHERGGIELLRRATIEAAMPSAVGNPVIVKHTLIDSDNRLMHEQGIVTDWYFDPSDGWFHVRGYVEGADAKGRIRRGEKPSCGYVVNSFGPGGKHHDIRYDKEITGLTFNHLAVVERPRFEDAAFRLNSIHVSQPKTMNVLKFLKKLVTRENGADGKPTETIKVVSHEVPSTTEVEIDGKRVPLSEVAAGFRANAAAATPAEPLQVATDDSVEIDGKPVLVSDLIAGYRKNAAAETPEQKAAREKADADAAALRINAAPIVVPPVAQPFITLHNARENAAAASVAATDAKRFNNSGTISDRCKAGQEKYGSVVVIATAGKN
jgi:hypothetical protein